MRSRLRRLALVATAATVGVVTVAPSVTSAHSNDAASDRTLAEVLLADSAKDDADGFDRRWWDYDIVTQAVLLFPDLVEAASDPDAELTVFLPKDIAFYRLVKDLTGTWPKSEADAFAAVASLGVDTVKAVLTYHIVPGAISYRDALRADGAVLTTLGGGTIEVDVKKRWWGTRVTLIDADTDDRNPRVVRPNIGGELANGYAHGINLVLRPVDLP
jgi:uncharacterized surface protein with fasciclin (FAS1) repeats